MPRFGSINRTKLIRYLKRVGFSGPFAGGNHQIMVRGDVRLSIPNPHNSDISVGLLNRLLNQAGISREEWEEL